MKTARFDAELGAWLPSVPGPFWIKTWRTLFRWRPYCTHCKKTFRDVSEYERHWVFTHFESEGQNK